MDAFTAAMSPPPLSEAALITWFAKAPVGARIAYHRGLLAFDASPFSPASKLPMLQRQQLQRVAARAWRLAEVGFAHLVQRRLGDFEFTYLLEVRPRPVKLTAKQAKLLVAIPAPAMAMDTPTEAPALAA